VMIEAPAAQAHDTLTKACLDAYGMTYDDFISMPRLGVKEQVTAMKDGTTDVVFYPGHPPQPSFAQLATEIDVNFIPIDEDKARAICEELPFYTYKNIPADTYRGQDKDVMCVGFTMVMAVRKEFPEDLAYQLVKTLLDKLDELSNVHPVYKELDLAIATACRGCPYHSGAVKYYQEKGMWTPELEEMQQRTLAELGQEK
jgi:TRAP transporter TAXI family solute receptor